jgi:hypothetical protein
MTPGSTPLESWPLPPVPKPSSVSVTPAGWNRHAATPTENPKMRTRNCPVRTAREHINLETVSPSDLPPFRRLHAVAFDDTV